MKLKTPYPLLPYHLNHGNSAKVYEKREWNRKIYDFDYLYLF
jgi:hypothetical protein